MSPLTEDLLRKPLPQRRSRPWLAWGLGFLTAVILADAVFGEAGYFAQLRAHTEYDRHAARLAGVRRENAILDERRRRLERDSAAIEDAARRDLGLLRRGEIVVLIHDRRVHP
jgi:cell division protein FtsB